MYDVMGHVHCASEKCLAGATLYILPRERTACITVCTLHLLDYSVHSASVGSWKYEGGPGFVGVLL